MARRRRKWQTQYNNELRNAKRRAKALAKRGVGYDFPETSPRNAREAQRRIQEFDRLRVSNIASRNLPRGSYGVATFETPFTAKATYKFPVAEVYRLQLLEERANIQRRRFGLEPKKYSQGRAFQSESAYRKYVSGLRKQGERGYQSARQQQYVDNYIQGLNSAIDVISDTDDQRLLRAVIRRIENIGTQQASQMLLDAERMGVSIHTIVFGSDQEVIKANIGIIYEFWFGKTP